MERYPLVCVALLSAALGAGGGCLPGGEGSAKVEHQKGLSMRELYPEKAREYFERAIRADPRHAAAHLELGYLFEGEGTLSDPNAAIYHFRKFIEFEPDSPLIGSTIEPRIANCIKDLTRNGNLQIVVQQMQSDLHARENEIQRLKERITELDGKLLDARDEIVKLVKKSGTVDAGASGNPGEAQSKLWTVYTILPNDTLYQIAKKHGVTAKDIMDMNRDLDSGRLKIGAQIRIPNF